MNHKRRRPKHQRGGCLFCKPYKDERAVKDDDRGGGVARALAATAADLRGDPVGEAEADWQLADECDYDAPDREWWWDWEDERDPDLTRRLRVSLLDAARVL